MQPRIDDVAREAGVSTATVSRVLNDFPVREATRKKVDAAIKKLNYSPNYMAKGLMSQKSFSVGVLVPTLSNHYFTEIVEALEDRLRSHNQMVLLCSTKDDPAREKEHVRNLITRRVDGVIIVDGTSENSRNGFFEEISAHTPLIVINGDTEGVPVNTVLTDQEEGMELSLDYLFHLGHRKIAFVRGKRGFSYDQKERIFRRYFEKNKIELDENCIVEISYGNTEESITMTEEKMNKLLCMPPRPTAIFACNDLMAMGVVNAAEKLHLDIPGELSVMGHDNTLVSKMGKITFTSVDIKKQTLGTTSADMLIQIMQEKNSEPRRLIFHPEIIDRGSCTHLHR